MAPLLQIPKLKDYVFRVEKELTEEMLKERLKKRKKEEQ
jgi:hypothetical protein